MNRPTILLLLGVAPCMSAVGPEGFEFTVKPFIRQNCVGCHNAKLTSGGLNLERYLTEPGAQALKDRDRWEMVVHKLSVGEMPPKGKRQPSAAERKALLFADLCNVKWKPQPGARGLRLAAELDPGNRIGPEKLWAKFDKALDQLGVALEGDGFAQLAAVYTAPMFLASAGQTLATAVTPPCAPAGSAPSPLT